MFVQLVAPKRKRLAEAESLLGQQMSHLNENVPRLHRFTNSHIFYRFNSTATTTAAPPIATINITATTTTTATTTATATTTTTATTTILLF